VRTSLLFRKGRNFPRVYVGCGFFIKLLIRTEFVHLAARETRRCKQNEGKLYAHSYKHLSVKMSSGQQPEYHQAQTLLS
jgi:hypothetical protein